MNMIDHLHIRIGGMSEDEARSFASSLANQLATRLEQVQLMGNREHISIKVQAGDGDPSGELTENILAQILLELKET